MNEAKSLKMREMPMGRLIASMSIPAIFSMFIQALYNVVDTYYVSKLDVSNDNMITAVGYAFPIQMLILAFSIGVGIGTNVIVAKKLGEKNNHEASNVARAGLVLALIGSLIFFVLSFIIAEPFMNFMSDNPVIIENGTIYLKICMMFSFFSIIEVICSKILQGMGRMIIPMFSQLIGAISNIILDPIFIFGRFGVPAYGVAGAAIATVIGQGLSMIFVVTYIFTNKFEIHFGFKEFKLRLSYIGQIFKVGLPSMIMNALGSLTNVFLNTILRMTDPTETANAVLVSYSKLQSFIFMPVFGLTQGGLPILSYNFGANIKERFFKALKILLITAITIMTIGFILFLSIPGELLGIFSPSDNLLAIGKPALRIISISFIPAAIGIISITAYQSLGRGLIALVMSASRQAILLVPLAFILAKIDGLKSVWYAFPLAEIIVAVTFFIILFKVIHRAFEDHNINFNQVVVEF